MKQWVVAALGVMLLAGLSPCLSAGESASSSGAPWRGVFEPRAQAVIASEVAMLVASMPKQPGDSCEEGDVLVEFDSSIPDAAVAAVEAKLEAAELNRNGMRNLYDRNQVTAVELARSESEVAGVRLELAAARRDAEACSIVAPFAGKLVDHKVREYEWASKGAPLLLMVDDSVLKVRFFLPENNFSTIKLGDRVRVTVPAASREVWGEVSRLGVIFDPVSRTFDVWADVPNVDDSLRVGMTAEIEWPVREKSQ